MLCDSGEQSAREDSVLISRGVVGELERRQYKRRGARSGDRCKPHEQRPGSQYFSARDQHVTSRSNMCVLRLSIGEVEQSCGCSKTDPGHPGAI